MKTNTATSERSASVSSHRERLALLGGAPTLTQDHPQLFHWPIVTEEDEQAVIAVLRAGTMSAIDITLQFEKEWAAYIGASYALAFCNGTASLQAAMFGVGLGRGDEIIAPSLTYWASTLQAFSLGATMVFADIDPETLCIDPNDIEHRITERTRAIMVVHYCGHPCDMDPIMALARRHNLKVIEDASHAHGAMYRGRMVGSIGDVCGASMMAGKALAIGEAGMLSTSDREIYERAVAFAHYERTKDVCTNYALPKLAAGGDRPTGLPLGGVKGRINQTCSAMGRVQLKHYPQRMAIIQKAMNGFWDLLEDVPGLSAHRPLRDSGSTMGGWYNPVGHYIPEELGGLPVDRFIQAVVAEGARTGRSCNDPLHLHPVTNEADIYRDGKPTRNAFATRDLRQPPGSLPVSEALPQRSIGVPWFKHDQPELIECYAKAFRKVATNYRQLL